MSFVYEYRIILDSKQNLERDARPVAELPENGSVAALIVDRECRKRYSETLKQLNSHIVVHSTRCDLGVLVALDRNGEFCGSYKL